MSNTANVVPFEFEGHDVRVVEIAGEPWFVAADVARALEYSQTNAMNKLIDDDDKMKRTILQNGGNYANQSLMSESGLYAAIFGSKLPSAKRFKKWVTSEVLPSIRKHGGYIQGQENMSGEELLAKAVLHAQSVIEEKDHLIQQHEKKIEEDAPKVDYYESVGDASGLMTLSEAIKSMNIGVGRNKAIEGLRSMKILQSSQTYWNQPYQQYINQGYFVMKQKMIPNGSMVSVTLVTPKGHQWLYKKLSQ